MSILNEIRAAKDAEGRLDYFGLRVVQEPLVKLGSVLPASRVWVDGEVTNRRLPGTSAVGVDQGPTESQLRNASGYSGPTLLLIGSTTMEYGEDEGEVILKNAKVIAAWHREKGEDWSSATRAEEEDATEPKHKRRSNLTAEQRSANARKAGLARAAAAGRKGMAAIGRLGLAAMAQAVTEGPPGEDYRPPPAAERWTPEEQARLADAGYMEVHHHLAPGFRCGSCAWVKPQEGPACADGGCSHPEVRAAVASAHGCCNYYAPDQGLGAPLVGTAWEGGGCEPGYRGAACGELVTPTGRERACYAVRPLDSLVTSHDPESWQPDPRYPALVQERDYTGDKRERLKVGRIAKRPDPRILLANNPTAVDGPPVVTANGIVLGGNGRTMGLRGAYAQGTAEPYVKELRKRAPMFGLTAEQVEQVAQPVLVRVVEGLDQASQRQLADASSRYNEGLTSALDERAKGVAVARRLSPETLAKLGRLLEDHETLRAAMAAAGPAIVERLRADGLVTAESSAALVADDGGLTDAGKAQLEGAFLGLVAATPERLAGASAETLGRLERLVPSLVQVQAVHPAADATLAFREALDLLHQAHASQMSVDQLLAQGSLFGGTDLQASPQGVEAAHLLQVGQKKLATAAKLWAQDAAKDPNQRSLFGRHATPQEAWEAFLGAAGVPAQPGPHEWPLRISQPARTGASSFTADVLQAAQAVPPDGRLGTRKVYLRALWEAYQPAHLGETWDSFADALVRAHEEEALDLADADATAGLDRELYERSAVGDPRAGHHFLIVAEGGAQ